MTFFQKLTYKQRNRFLISAAAIFLFIVYFLGIKKTLAKYRECKELEDKVQLAVSAPAELIEIEKQFIIMEKRMESYDAGINVQQSLLGVVSKYCSENRIVLKDFTQPVISTVNNVTLETNMFVVEGEFTKALMLVYNLEQINKLGRVASVHFSLKKDYATRTNNLFTTVYVQNIKNENNEE